MSLPPPPKFPYICLIGFKVLKAVFRLPFTSTHQPSQIPRDNSWDPSMIPVTAPHYKIPTSLQPGEQSARLRRKGQGGCSLHSQSPHLPHCASGVRQHSKQQKLQIWYATYNSIVLTKWESGLSSGNLTIKTVQSTFSTFKSLMKTSINSSSLRLQSIQDTKILLIHQIISFRKRMLSNYF